MPQQVAAKGDWANEAELEPELVKKAIRAALKGLQFSRANPTKTIKIIMDWVHLPERDAARVYELSKLGFSMNGFASDDDLNIEWSLLQREAKKTNVPVSGARDFSLLLEVQQQLRIR